MKTIIQTLGLSLLITLSAQAQDTPPAKPKGPNPEKMFKKLDTDGNASLSLEEFKASPRGQKNPTKAEEAYKKMDSDSKDGVSLEEFKAFTPKQPKKK